MRPLKRFSHFHARLIFFTPCALRRKQGIYTHTEEKVFRYLWLGWCLDNVMLLCISIHKHMWLSVCVVCMCVCLYVSVCVCVCMPACTSVCMNRCIPPQKKKQIWYFSTARSKTPTNRKGTTGDWLGFAAKDWRFKAEKSSSLKHFYKCTSVRETSWIFLMVEFRIYFSLFFSLSFMIQSICIVIIL